MTESRFARQIPFLTEHGQRSLEDAKITVVGAGGLGCHVVQQLLYLGARNLTVIDPDTVERSNLNRLVWCMPKHIGRKKVDVLAEVANELDAQNQLRVIKKDVRSRDVLQHVTTAQHIVGCLDHDGPRFLLTQIASAYRRPYLDLASELGTDRTSFGGRLFLSLPGEGCLWCSSLLRQDEVSAWLDRRVDREFHRNVYGQQVQEQVDSGPSVVSVNGVIASLGVTELMVAIAGIRQPVRHRRYLGSCCAVTAPDTVSAHHECPICQGVVGKGDDADIDRFLDP